MKPSGFRAVAVAIALLAATACHRRPNVPAPSPPRRSHACSNTEAIACYLCACEDHGNSQTFQRHPNSCDVGNRARRHGKGRAGGAVQLCARPAIEGKGAEACIPISRNCASSTAICPRCFHGLRPACRRRKFRLSMTTFTGSKSMPSSVTLSGWTSSFPASIFSIVRRRWSCRTPQPSGAHCLSKPRWKWIPTVRTAIAFPLLMPRRPPFSP